jgi:hypothetical protein
LHWQGLRVNDFLGVSPKKSCICYVLIKTGNTAHMHACTHIHTHHVHTCIFTYLHSGHTGRGSLNSEGGETSLGLKVIQGSLRSHLGPTAPGTSRERVPAVGKSYGERLFSSSASTPWTSQDTSLHRVVGPHNP